MVVEFYYHPQSPPSQTVWMILKELGIKYEAKLIDILTGQQKTEEYKAINPLQKVPAIKDGDLLLAESRAVSIYLCQKYEPEGKENKLYPTDRNEAAKINMSIFSDLDGLVNVFKYINGEAVFYGKGIGPLEEFLPKVKSWLGDLERRLREHKYLGADHLTVLDFFATNAIGLLEIANFDCWDEFPGVQNWKKAMESLPYFDECFTKPFQLSKQFYQGQIQKFKKENPQK